MPAPHHSVFLQVDASLQADAFPAANQQRQSSESCVSVVRVVDYKKC